MRDESISAFPIPCERPFGDGHLATGGMSLRDYFAAKAMKIAHEDQPECAFDELAQMAYALADAMLAERAK